jgi:hypothetical protein
MEEDLNNIKMGEDNQNFLQSNSIKLTKNTKGYFWEIKVLDLDIDKLEKLNNEMKKRFID